MIDFLTPDSLNDWAQLAFGVLGVFVLAIIVAAAVSDADNQKTVPSLAPVLGAFFAVLLLGSAASVASIAL